MYNFVVLGLIPGTNIQISFTMWAEMAALLIMLRLLVRTVRQQQVRTVLAEERNSTIALQPLDEK